MRRALIVVLLAFPALASPDDAGGVALEPTYGSFRAETRLLGDTIDRAVYGARFTYDRGDEGFEGTEWDVYGSALFGAGVLTDLGGTAGWALGSPSLQVVPKLTAGILWVNLDAGDRESVVEDGFDAYVGLGANLRLRAGPVTPELQLEGRRYALAEKPGENQLVAALRVWFTAGEERLGGAVRLERWSGNWDARLLALSFLYVY